ncbi:unnamed protein product, partial [Iphiclides podalirius]
MMSTTEADLDVEVSLEREEGELEDSDVEEGTYIPLARPEAFNPPSLVNMQIQDEVSDEPSPEESSASESDEEPRRRPKRTKLRLRQPHQQQPSKRNKYNVWCKTVQEDLLTEDMKPRYLPDLMVTLKDPLDNIAKEIAEKLSEEKKDLVGRIIQELGASKAIEIYKETQRVEADGGMLVMNGTRRRTPGGIYFFLLKHDEDISQAMINQIFNEDRKDTSRKIKKARGKSRQKVMEQLKQSLTDSELPSLLSRGEATVKTEHGSNPPPSPATDARECSSDTDGHSHTDAPLHSPSRAHSPLPNRTDPRQIQDYDDDDFLEVMCNDDMDLF